MGMDPKQRRALSSDRASEADTPRDTRRESARAQEAEPPGSERRPPRRTTVGMAGERVNLESDTPVERLAREMGEEQIREVGRTGTLREHRRERSREAADAGGARRESRPPATAPAEPLPSADVAQQTLYSRREHSKGDGNLPAAEPHPSLADERPRDRTPHDLPKERDDRSAPKGNATRGQAERNPSLEARDDYDPELRQPESGFERASAAATRRTRPRRPASGTRPKARRSSAAKRKITTRTDPRSGRAKANVRQAPRSASRSGRRAAVARKPQVGSRRTGTAPRGDAVPRSARGNVNARKAAKASRASATDRRKRAKRAS